MALDENNNWGNALKILILQRKMDIETINTLISTTLAPPLTGEENRFVESLIEEVDRVRNEIQIIEEELAQLTRVGYPYKEESYRNIHDAIAEQSFGVPGVKRALSKFMH